MFSPIHPSYQTLRRKKRKDAPEQPTSSTRPLSLGDIYERIDEDLAER